MSKKTSQHSKKKPNSPKALAWHKDLRSLLSWNDIKLNQKNIEAICQELLDWVLKDSSWDFQEFYNFLGMSRQNFESYRKTYSDIDKTWLFAKDVLGERRQRKTTFKEYEVNHATVIPTLRRYHPDWQSIHEEEVAIKTMMAEKSGNEPVVVTIQRDKNACSA